MLQNLLYCLSKQFVVVIVKYRLGITDFSGFVSVSIYICTSFIKMEYSLSECN